MDKSTYSTMNIYGQTIERARILPTEPNKTYTLSAILDYNGTYFYYLSYILPNGTIDMPRGRCYQMWNNFNHEPVGHARKTCTFTTVNQADAVYYVYFATYTSPSRLRLSEYQMEEGTTATPYVPYGNIYIPAGE